MITTALSEAFGQYTLKPHQIIPLDFHSVDTLPETHVWLPPPGFEVENNDAGDGQLVFPVPVIDFSDPDEAAAGKLMVEACETWGVFQLVNHGIPLEILAAVEAQTKRLFALPASRKLEALRSPNGVNGYGQARFASLFDKNMWNEGFTVMGSPADHARKLWPDDFQGFCDVIDDYQNRTRELAARLLGLILRSANTPEQEIRRISSPSATMTTLQLNSYPRCPDPTRAMGMAPHTDTSFLTLLYQGGVKGLQIFSDRAGGGGGGWGMVDPVDGAITVNVGDLLHVVSNARFHTARHRVVLREARQRVSVGLFFVPTPDCVLSPLACGGGGGEGEVCRYRAVSVKEYIGLKYKGFETVLSAITK
ncbi:unnamed protein product [Linum trigynum]|uniref:Fe2OG dioxygenase domain-containing protein n=1 Tax=Linum trigynum TaxID=586398 RepID=A0AAV2DME4_9ROSI